MNTSLVRSAEFKRSYYLHTAIVILIMLSGYFIPPFGHITQMGIQTIAIFLGVCWGWCFLSLGWPSVLGVIAFGLLGYKPMNGVLSSAFGNPTMIQVLLLLTVIMFVTVSGLAEYIARWMLSRKFARRSSYVFIFTIFLSSYLLAVICNGSPAQLVITAIVIGIMLECGYSKGDKLPTVLLLGVCVSTILGAAVPPYTVVGIGLTKGYTIVTGNEINFLSYFLTNNIIMIPLLIILTLMVKYYFRVDTSKLEEKIAVASHLSDDLKMNTDQKIAIFVLIAFLLCVFLPGMIPHLPFTIPGAGFIRKLGVNALCMLILIVGICVQVSVKGGYKCAVDVNKCLSKLPWDLLTMQGFCCELAVLVMSDGTGIFPSILALLKPLATGLGKFAFIMLISAFVLGLTQISHNVILANVMPPLVLPMGMACGIEPHIMISCMVLPVALGIVIPSGSACAAIFYGTSEWVNTQRGFTGSLAVFCVAVLYNCIAAYILSSLF
jgi:sodium-dependent dicarboxylate transporter 2/3/5